MSHSRATGMCCTQTLDNKPWSNASCSRSGVVLLCNRDRVMMYRDIEVVVTGLCVCVGGCAESCSMAIWDCSKRPKMILKNLTLLIWTRCPSHPALIEIVMVEMWTAFLRSVAVMAIVAIAMFACLCTQFTVLFPERPKSNTCFSLLFSFKQMMLAMLTPLRRNWGPPACAFGQPARTRNNAMHAEVGSGKASRAADAAQLPRACV